jgi:sarcosine oxidase/L-pipecolate oxidase
MLVSGPHFSISFLDAGADVGRRDAVTPNQDWIISPHPACPDLFIATGGSFHAFKFLPVIGKYVTAMMDGTLDDERVGRWAWNRRATEGGACVTYIPKRDLSDILAAESMKPRV